MCAFRSVKIIHDIVHRADYIFLSEFLRFIGVLVQEDILFDREIDKTVYEKDTKFSACVFIGEKSPGENNQNLLNPIVDKEEYTDLVERLPGDTLFFYDEIIKGGILIQSNLVSWEVPGIQNQCLAAIVNKILYQISQKVERNQYHFDKLISVFTENRLFLHSISMQYYSKTKTTLAREAKEAFIKAYGELEQIGGAEKYEDSVRAHYLYALLWTKVKTNMASDYLGEILYFSEEKMFEACRNLIVDYPEFSNAKVLLGLCYEPLKNRTRDALIVFRQALEDMGRECFAASIYYWMGKKYEIDGRYPEQMKECYRLSNERGMKFRSLFKLGVIAGSEEKYQDALVIFDSILKKLQAKDAIGYTDPLELEYMQKAYLQKCIVYHQQKRYDKVQENMKLAEAVKTSIKANRFYDILYSERADEYRELSEKRVKIQEFKKLVKEDS